MKKKSTKHESQSKLLSEYFADMSKGIFLATVTFAITGDLVNPVSIVFCLLFALVALICALGLCGESDGDDEHG